MKSHHLSKKFIDWKFVFKLTALILITALSIPTMIISIFIENWYVNDTTKDIFYHYAWIQNADITFSFWTTQTSLLVGMWFLLALIFHNREMKNKFNNFTTQTSITIYITITAIIFWCGIFFSKVFAINVGLGWFWQLKPKAIVIAFFDHLIAPTFMILYWFLSNTRNRIIFSKQLRYVVIYPVIYLCLVYARAAFLTYYHVKNFVYPYEILNLSKPLIKVPIALNIILVVLLIVSSLTGVTALYCWFNKLFLKVNKVLT